MRVFVLVTSCWMFALAAPSCSNNADCLARGLPLPRPKRLHRPLFGPANKSRRDLSTPIAKFEGRAEAQMWTAPATGTYLFNVRGARGGSAGYGGGAGATLNITYADVQAGARYSFYVGLQGADAPSSVSGGGGGGGTFVVLPDVLTIGVPSLVIAAGGGGGDGTNVNNAGTGFRGSDATLLDVGTAQNGNVEGGGSRGGLGFGGGGSTPPSSGAGAGGGAGYRGAGQAGTTTDSARGGNTFPDFAGGAGAIDSFNNFGTLLAADSGGRSIVLCDARCKLIFTASGGFGGGGGAAASGGGGQFLPLLPSSIRDIG